MEAHKNYFDFNELVSSIARIVNNLDQMTEIMKTTSVKITPEKVKQINALYGMSAAGPLPDWDPEILRSEIQDLKLENDRLKQRDDIMVKFIRSVRCIGIMCDKCDFNDDAHHCLFYHGSISKEVLDLYMVFSDKAEEILERLDNL